MTDSSDDFRARREYNRQRRNSRSSPYRTGGMPQLLLGPGEKQ